MSKTSVWILIISCLLIVSGTTHMGAGEQQTTVYIYPESHTVPDVGLEVTVNISIQNVVDLFGWELKLYYPNNILNGSSATEGPFLSTGRVFTLFSVHIFTDAYNETHGLLNVFCLRTDAESGGADGDGVLATVIFTSKSTNGPKILQLDNVKLADSNADSIPCVTVNGEITVIPEFPTMLLPLALAVSTLMLAVLKKLRNPREEHSRARITMK